MPDNNLDQNRNPGGFGEFLEGMADFAQSYTSAYVRYFEEDSRPELGYVKMQMDTVNHAFGSISTELQRGFKEADEETQALVARHVGNSGVVPLMRNSSAMFIGSGVLGFLDKVGPILEIIKKIVQQIVDLFPKFLSGILDKIINPLLEILDNILPIITDLFGGSSATRLMVDAEHRFLDSHPKWRNLHFSGHPDRMRG